MANGAAQDEPVPAFDHDDRQAETWNFNAANQAAGRGPRPDSRRSRGRGANSCVAGFPPVMQQLFELAALGFLEMPTVRQNQSAITQHQDGNGAQYPLARPQGRS